MFVVSGGKGTGKTKELAQKAKETNGILVCENPTKMRERIYKYGITGVNIISYDDFVDCSVTVYGQPIYIHNLEELIKYRWSEIEGFSVCNE
jgi:hypothetical protein